MGHTLTIGGGFKYCLFILRSLIQFDFHIFRWDGRTTKLDSGLEGGISHLTLKVCTFLKERARICGEANWGG